MFNYLTTLCQKETNNWLISDSSWINFNISHPIVKNNYKCTVFEACASISDINGNLLFYTNGKNVFDKNGQYMPNTSLFDNTFTDESTQGALIVPKRDSNTQYYLFLNFFRGSFKSLFYTIIDMSLNGGKGDVMFTPKLMYDNGYTFSSEKFTIVKHCNNLDYWVISTELYNYADSAEIYPNKYSFNERIKDFHFLAFNLNQYGITNLPIKSRTNIQTNVCEAAFPFSVGPLKFSPDGKIAAFAHYEDLYLYDFDNSTGKFTYKNKFHYIGSINQPDFCDYVAYGIEFFPDGKKIMFNNMFIDLTSNNTYLVGNFLYSQMQLASDDKIYFNYNTKLPNQIGVNTKNFLSFFEFKSGAAHVFYDTIWLKKDYTTLGLPNFPSFYFNKVNYDFKYTGSCVNSIFTFIPNFNGKPFTNVEWTFFDDNTTTTNINATHTYSSKGEYEVQLVVFNGNQSDTIKQCVTVLGNNSNFFTKPDTFVCYNKYIDIGVTYPNIGHYKWNTGDTTSALTINKAGQYILTITNECANYSDTINVSEEVCHDGELIIPNIFTPNHDFVNDIFTIKTSYYKYLEFILVDRWGQEVATKQIEITQFNVKLQNQWTFELWNGLLKNGDDADDGTYFYVIKATEINDKIKTYKGWLQLQR